jgi:hypothetical protein
MVAIIHHFLEMTNTITVIAFRCANWTLLGTFQDLTSMIRDIFWTTITGLKDKRLPAHISLGH